MKNLSNRKRKAAKKMFKKQPHNWHKFSSEDYAKLPAMHPDAEINQK